MAGGEKNKKKVSGEWSETCIGLWSQSTFGPSSPNKRATVKSSTLCTGINLVQIKNLDVNAVKPSDTVGFQIIIHETIQQEENSPTDISKRGGEYSFTDHVFTTYQQKLSALSGQWAKFKDHSVDVTQLAKEFSASPDKMQRVNTFFLKEYNHLREWFESNWK